ncbi:hypothetical protein PS723_06267 [Pseudomonas fluorescens]|uniref:DUF3757 domain-containing protein n=2 Tax=Pseudomonas fluorescens TaxID=294 RepID=A0A5E7FYT3_PSEFL|nr:hypothetical protein PS723_06267 [Pseudomonas fluorescens]
MLRCVFFSLFFTLPVSGWAMDIDHCPTPERIKNKQGIYTASTISRQGQWIGALSSDAPAAITRFIRAVYFSNPTEGMERGILHRCTYRTASNEMVDLNFHANKALQLSVRLLDRENWKKRNSPTGLHMYVCTSKEEGGCVFSVLE